MCDQPRSLRSPLAPQRATSSPEAANALTDVLNVVELPTRRELLRHRVRPRLAAGRRGRRRARRARVCTDRNGGHGDGGVVALGTPRPGSASGGGEGDGGGLSLEGPCVAVEVGEVAAHLHVERVVATVTPGCWVSE